MAYCCPGLQQSGFASGARPATTCRGQESLGKGVVIEGGAGAGGRGQQHTQALTSVQSSLAGGGGTWGRRFSRQQPPDSSRVEAHDITQHTPVLQKYSCFLACIPQTDTLQKAATTIQTAESFKVQFALFHKVFSNFQQG